LKLASLKQGRDGQLVVVSRDLARGLRVPDIAASLQHALDDWAEVEPKLRAASGLRSYLETPIEGLWRDRLSALAAAALILAPAAARADDKDKPQGFVGVKLDTAGAKY
jgi:hypothetical protein